MAHLQARLRAVTERVDAAFPDHTALPLDAAGKPHLKRLTAQPLPAALATLEAWLTARLPARHLLDVLKNVHPEMKYTRPFGPPSGADPPLPEAVSRSLCTRFGYASALGATHTARHTPNRIGWHPLRRRKAQPSTTAKLAAALRDVINAYTRFELPFFWGRGHTAMADGTHVERRANTLLGARPIRSGRFGGIAYHHISET